MIVEFEREEGDGRWFFEPCGYGFLSEIDDMKGDLPTMQRVVREHLARWLN